MKKIVLLISFFIFSFSTIALCQNDNDVVANATSKLKTLINDHIIEKAYLHIDHPYACYVAGDEVYFKAYVTMGELHQPSAISRVLHVDLIDKNNVILNSISLLLNNGTGWGDFMLPETLQKGSYRIRAYTDWMRNEKQPNFFEQYISVSSPVNNTRVAESTTTGMKPNLQFFPEGGNLVSRVPSKIAFKAIGPDGLGMSFKGVIVDNLNTEVVKIVPTHLGMGEFDLRPEQGKTYSAKVTFADGSQSVFALPAADQKGITLAVDNTTDPNKIAIEIKANQAYYRENLNKDLILIIYEAGSVRTVKTKLDNPVLGLDLKTSDYRTGILQVTLLSQTGEPLNERLAFVHGNDLLNLSVTTNKEQFTKRENVALIVQAKNKDGNPVNGSFSISVIDESKILVDENTENSILSYLLLTTDLKGYVEKPNYYFANVTGETRRDLDVLMLSQGYRRFSWKQLLSDNSLADVPAFKPENSFYVTGELKTNAGTPLPDNTVNLIPENGGQTYTSVTDAQGKFKFTDVFFETGTHFIIKTQAGKNGIITIDNPPAGPVVSPANQIESKYNGSADLLASLQNIQKPGLVTASLGNAPLLIQENRQESKKINNSNNYRSSNLGGPGHADQVILADQFKNAPTLSTGLNGVARGVQFAQGVPYLPNAAIVQGSGQSTEPMLVVVDGSTIGMGVNIDSYNPNDIETVEVLKGPNATIYGMEGGAGVLVLTSRLGGEKTETNITKEMSPGIFSVAPQGLYKAKQFYMPVYEANQAGNSVADRRTTIFWKPDVNTDADGNASFSFYNADGTGTYRVVIEGIDKKGNLGRQVFRYKVQ